MFRLFSMPTNPDTFKKDENRAPRKLPVNPVNGYRRGILFSAVQKLKHENGRWVYSTKLFRGCNPNWLVQFFLAYSFVRHHAKKSEIGSFEINVS